MTFERQKCKVCKRICFCVDIRSLDSRKYHFTHAYWVCEYDLPELLAPGKTIIEVEKIMIECGIEDIE